LKITQKEDQIFIDEDELGLILQFNKLNTSDHPNFSFPIFRESLTSFDNF